MCFGSGVSMSPPSLHPNPNSSLPATSSPHLESPMAKNHDALRLWSLGPTYQSKLAKVGHESATAHIHRQKWAHARFKKGCVLLILRGLLRDPAAKSSVQQHTQQKLNSVDNGARCLWRQSAGPQKGMCSSDARTGSSCGKCYRLPVPTVLRTSISCLACTLGIRLSPPSMGHTTASPTPQYHSHAAQQVCSIIPLKSCSALSSTSRRGLTCFCSRRLLAAVRDVKISSSAMSNPSFCSLPSRSRLHSFVVLVTKRIVTGAPRSLSQGEHSWMGYWILPHATQAKSWQEKPTYLVHRTSQLLVATNSLWEACSRKKTPVQLFKTLTQKVWLFYTVKWQTFFADISTRPG